VDNLRRGLLASLFRQLVDVSHVSPVLRGKRQTVNR
jgi:hypothetical protein